MEAIYLPVPKLLKEQTLGSEKLARALGGCSEQCLTEVYPGPRVPSTAHTAYGGSLLLIPKSSKEDRKAVSAWVGIMRAGTLRS